MIKTIEHNRDIVICCPEAIAYSKKWLNDEQIKTRAEIKKKNNYGKYLNKLVEKGR